MYAQKTIFTFSFSVTLTFRPQICSQLLDVSKVMSPQNLKFLRLSDFE